MKYTKWELAHTILQPTTIHTIDSVLLKSWTQQKLDHIKVPTKDYHQLDTSSAYKWEAQVQQSNDDAVTVSGDTGSLTAGAAPGGE